VSVGRQLLWLLFRLCVAAVVLFCNPFCLYGERPWTTFWTRGLIFTAWVILHSSFTSGRATVAARTIQHPATGALR
jgi:hypothetical protein